MIAVLIAEPAVISRLRRLLVLRQLAFLDDVPVGIPLCGFGVLRLRHARRHAEWMPGGFFASTTTMAIDEKEILHGEAALEKIRGLLGQLPIAFMVTVHEGTLTARPIGVVGDHQDFDGTLWFITDKRSRKVAAIESGALTTLLFQNDKEGSYLHLSGRAAVVEDRQRLEELYTTLQRTWFPRGLDDPDITLVRFDAVEANYWDSHDSYVRLAAAFAKSLVTGSPGKSGNAGIAKLG